jgi:hypothetical protein
MCVPCLIGLSSPVLPGCQTRVAFETGCELSGRCVAGYVRDMFQLEVGFIKQLLGFLKTDSVVYKYK